MGETPDERMTRVLREQAADQAARRVEEARRLREQIQRDQATNAKRDAEALRRERDWHRRNG